MHFEKYGFDILNHPPHHLSRFSVRSYEMIAQKLNCDIKYNISPSSSFFNRFIISLKVALKGIHLNKLTLLKKSIQSPILSIKVLIYSIFKSDKNTILVELSLKKSFL
jgi:hypothetical protein